MKALVKEFGALVFSLLQVILGILLLVDPVGFTSGIIVTFGVFLLVLGVFAVVRYFRTEAFYAAKSQSLFRGLIFLIAGGFCALKYQWFIATFPVLTILYGVLVLLTGLGKVQWTVDMIRMKKPKWFLAAISAVIAIVCSAVILSDPFTSTTVLWIFTGISLIVDAVFDIVAVFLSERDGVFKEAE